MRIAAGKMAARPANDLGGRAPIAEAFPFPKSSEAAANAAAGLTVVADDGEAAASARPMGAPPVSVVIPALNEAQNLPHVLPKVPAWVDEVILVDDHSSDETVAVAQALHPGIRIVPNLRDPGKGNALQAGWEAATGEIIVQVDADGSEDPAEIHAFVGTLLAGADYAKGSRFIPGGGTTDMTGLRKAGNRVFVWMVRVLFGAKFTDLCYGYNGFWKRVVPRLQIDADGFEVEAMLNIRAVREGLRIAEVPSFEAERVHGQGRLVTFPDGWRVLRTIANEWRIARRERRAAR